MIIAVLLVINAFQLRYAQAVRQQNGELATQVMIMRGDLDRIEECVPALKEIVGTVKALGLRGMQTIYTTDGKGQIQLLIPVPGEATYAVSVPPECLLP